MIKNCTKCGSDNLGLKIQGAETDFEKAKQVALICKSCGKWLKWCPKDERKFYVKQPLSTAQKLLYIIDHYHIEQTVDNLYKMLTEKE